MASNLSGLTIKDEHLRRALEGREYLLVDGAMGTQMQERGLDALEAVLFQKLRRLFIHGICIFNSHMYELIFVSQEYIFRYCKSRQGS